MNLIWTILINLQAAKDDVLGELLDQCRVNQQRVMLLVNTTEYATSSLCLGLQFVFDLWRLESDWSSSSYVHVSSIPLGFEKLVGETLKRK